MTMMMVTVTAAIMTMVMVIVAELVNGSCQMNYEDYDDSHNLDNNNRCLLLEWWCKRYCTGSDDSDDSEVYHSTG